MLKTVAEVSPSGGPPASDAIALATDNAGSGLGVEHGVLDPGRPADMVLLQEPWRGTQPGPLESLEFGDISGICAVIIDGQIRALRSRDTPAAARQVVVKARNRSDR
jgi:enamidase